MRLIDADELKEIVGECPENWTDSPEEVEAFNMWHRVMDDIDSTPTISGWISVKDRLPEKSQQVLVRIRNLTRICNYSEKWRVFNHYDELGQPNKGDRTWYDVTYWMPLPEPPEEENEDE